ncbi:DUF2461 domain-containing protein [Christiangramia sp. LLG6405-1]|uniref:DUF2461 domain-containing protein n=1 Tax=Christiangramia sp. LLG6405-1 TaxID=3160832 RepID=UPI003864B48F
MDFRRMFTFLRELNKNNSKEWMDEHRKEYHHIRDSYILWLNELDIKLANVDENYAPTEGKKAINRINNNLMFHPNKPIYKDHFGAGLDDKPEKGDFYIHIGINGSFVAGGFYRPKKSILDSIRSAIDYNGAEFKELIAKESFVETFDGLVDDEKLKTAPKGFSKDHEHIELLRNKTFAVQVDLTQKQILKKDFQEKLVEIYREMLPFRNYLNKAITV